MAVARPALNVATAATPDPSTASARTTTVPPVSLGRRVRSPSVLTEASDWPSAMLHFTCLKVAWSGFTTATSCNAGRASLSSEPPVTLWMAMASTEVTSGASVVQTTFDVPPSSAVLRRARADAAGS